MSQDNYLVDPTTGQKFPVGGCIISNKPSDAPKFSAMRVVQSKQLPPEVDLRSLMTPVEDQLQTNAWLNFDFILRPKITYDFVCFSVANAFAGAYEFLIMKNSRKHVDVSRLFIYFNARLIDGLEDCSMQDRGTQITSAIKALADYGCCKENILPYRTELIDQRPPKQCYDEAKHYRIASSMSIDTNLDEMKACLAEGYPFVFALQLFQSFRNAGSNYGRVQMPKPHEQQAAQHSWHALLAVGYSDPSRCFIVRNSWGPEWGDKGYCYIPYAYMTNRQRCLDLHAIKAVTKESNRDTDRNIHNPFVWNTDKDKKKKNLIPDDYHYPDFHYKYFWRFSNLFNYFNSLFQNGQIKPFFWLLGEAENPNEQEKSNSPNKLILWIDRKHSESASIENQLLSYDKSIEIEFCETMQKAQNYVLSNKDSLRLLPNFQIISRGFYKDENKNPLNLLEFLLSERIHNGQVLVFTQDKKGVEYHLGKRAPTFHLPNWKEIITICDNSTELIEKIKEAFNEIKAK